MDKKNNFKHTLDCRDVIEKDLGKPRSRAGKAWSWPCPLHSEKSGTSLSAWADGWRCWGKCQQYGDAIAWVRAYHGLDFRSALAYLGISGGDELQARCPKLRFALPSQADTPPPENWQKRADLLVYLGQETLWGKEGRRALDYLMLRRGLKPDIIRLARLGFIAGRPDEWRQIAGLQVPAGILIPNYCRGQLWGVRVRRAAGSPKYLSVKGSKLIGGLYQGDFLTQAWPQFQTPILVESEFDALTLWQALPDAVPVALSSASNRLTDYWIDKLVFYSRLFARLDGDMAGGAALARLGSLSGRFRSVAVPAPYKDINEFFVAAGMAALTDWWRDISYAHT